MEHLDCKSQLWQKSQRSKSTLSQSQRRSTVWSTSWSMMTSDDWRVTSADNMAVMTSPRADVSKSNLVRHDAWRRVGARDGSWRCVEARGARELLRKIFWQRVRACGSSDDGQVSTIG